MLISYELMLIVCFSFLVESDLITQSAFPISTVIIAVAVVVAVALVLIAVVLIVALVSQNRRSTIDLRKEEGGDGR
jgi:multisubunit Na+/H+ antiporter MnhC subunit